MKLSLTLIDERPKLRAAYQTRIDGEEYVRVSLADFDANSPVVAALLRGIANDIDPDLRAEGDFQ